MHLGLALGLGLKVAHVELDRLGLRVYMNINSRVILQIGTTYLPYNLILIRQQNKFLN